MARYLSGVRTRAARHAVLYESAIWRGIVSFGTWGIPIFALSESADIAERRRAGTSRCAETWCAFDTDQSKIRSGLPSPITGVGMEWAGGPFWIHLEWRRAGRVGGGLGWCWGVSGGGGGGIRRLFSRKQMQMGRKLT